MDALHPQTHTLIAKMASIVSLTSEEQAALQRLPMQVQTLRADQDIVREGDRPSRCCLIIEGFAARYGVTEEGKRQIYAFHIPGEIPDLQSLHIETMDHSLQTVTPCKVGFIQHEALLDLCSRYPRLAGAFWRETLIDGAIFRLWIKNLGRREANAHMAHFFCEMMTRLKAIGRVENLTCAWPFTQGEMGDALGLSAVHVNRVLQVIRGAGLITLTKDRLTVLDWDGLVALGEFDPRYLHQQPREAA
jgi:CRP-like cAMP-binding protein